MIEPTEEQKRLIEFIPESNLLIRGEAGSGKTTILALRGGYVNQKNPGSMLFLTFNSALETHLKQLAEEGDLEDVTVTTFHSWVHKFATKCDVEPPKFASDTDRKELLEQALNDNSDKWGAHRLYSCNEGFWKDELRFVFGQGLGARRRYLDAPRSGMGTAVRVSKEDKEMIYDVISSYRKRLRAGNLYDGDDPAGVVLATVKETGGLFPKEARYDHVFIDEVQDFDASWLQALAPVARKSMSLAGDLAQRIYPRSFTWQGVGIPIPPARSKKLEGSHRTTREIMQVAIFLADNKDLQDNEDYQAPTLPPRSGPKVMRIQRSKFWEAEEALVKHVEGLRRRHPEHGALRAASAEGYPPAVFHKGDLDGEFGGLASAVESKISETKNKIVAVVLNAIDDHLDRDDQILGHWHVESIKYLVNLLNLAFHSGRTVVLASDHGHVLERSSELRKGNGMGGARWQVGRPAQEGEVLLTGPRVLCDAKAVAMPWSERVRYTMKKNGYHGGAHPREVLAPLAVLGPIDRPLKGWIEVRHAIPTWWHQGTPLKVSVVPTLSYQPKSAPASNGQLALFEEGPPPSDLPQRILDFPLVAQQWKAQKNAPPMEWTLPLLRLLEQHGRQASVVDLSLALNLPEVRFRHLLGQLGPLLTLDGVPMLGLTADGLSVFLNPKPVEELPAAPVAKKSRSDTLIEVERNNGELIAFAVPLPKLDAVERPILEGLARHGSLTEAQLKKITNTKRVAGAVEKLMEKLHKAGFPHLTQAGDGDQGRIYVLKLEALL